MRTWKGAVPVMLLLLAPAAIAEGRVEQRRPLAANGSVSVENIAGSVKVIGWDRDEVEVIADLGRGTSDLEIEEGGRHLRIEVTIPSGRNHDLEGSELVLHVPRGAELEVETISADIDVEGVEGPVSLETVSGRIEARGRIRELSAETVSGNIQVAAAGLEEGDFGSVSGSITVSGALDPRGDFSLETVSGSVDLTVPGGFGAQFEIETFSGSIKTDFGPSPEKDRFIGSQELRFSRGSGASVSLSSFSGSVRLREQ